MGYNPTTDLPNDASKRPTWSFHERYASDAEFKRQVDEARRRSASRQSQQALNDALKAQRDRKKLY